MRRQNYSLRVVRKMAWAAILFSVFLFPALLHAQDNLAGHWEGTVTLPTKTIPIQVDFEQVDSGWKSTILFPETTAPVYAAKSVSAESGRVRINLEMGFSSVSLDGQLSGEFIEGTFTQDSTKAKFKVKRTASAKPAGADASKRTNSAPQPGRDESPTAGPAKTPGGGESSRTSGPQVQSVAATAPREPRDIRDDQGESRGVIPSATADAGDSDTGMPNFYAVMFASDNYDSADWPHLNNPVDDAKSIARELHNFYGFHAEVYENQTYSAIKHILVDDYQKRNFKPNDELLIFFAGHGDFDPDDNRGYVITKDSSPPGSDRDREIDFPKLITWMDKINVGHILLVLDICQGGTIFEQERGNVPAPSIHETSAALQRLRGVKTRKCMTSGGKGAVKDGHAGQGSPFATTFIEVLGEAGPNTDDMVLNVDEVAGKIKKTMGRLSDATTPEFGSCATDKPTSDFFFFWQAPQK
jgi:hypothetical protein